MSKPPKYSPSKLLKYIECPAQYKDLYPRDYNSKDRAKQEPSPIPDAGKVAHRVLELAGRKRLNKPTEERDPVTKKELLELLELALREPPDEKWKDPTILTPEVVEQAAGLLSTPSCWKKVSFTHTIKVEQAFEQPISGGPQFGTLQQPFSLSGIMDRIDELPDGRIKVVDYKTGWSVMSRAEAELDPQINMYLAAAARMFPGRQVAIELHYLARGVKLGPLYYSPTRDEWLIPFLRAVVHRINTWERFPETPGMPQCMSCHRRSVCVSYERMLKGTMAPGNRTMAENLESYALLNDIEKAADTGKKVLRKVIREACDNADDGEVFGGNYKATLSFKNKVEYPDGRRTAIAAARAMLPIAVPMQPDEVAQPVEIPSDPVELVKKHADPVELAKDYIELSKKLVEAKTETAQLKTTNGKLQRAALEIRTAFDVLSSITKVQAGQVDDFTEALPEDLQGPVGAAIDATATNAGYYTVDVEKLQSPFYDPDPTPEEIAMAEAQEKANQEAAVEREAKAKARAEEKAKAEERAKEMAAKAEAEKAQAAAAPPAPDQKTESAPPADQPAETPKKSRRSRKKSDVKAEPDTKADDAGESESKSDQPKPWAQADCVACGGKGMSSSGKECSPCMRRYEAQSTQVATQPQAAEPTAPSTPEPASTTETAATQDASPETKVETQATEVQATEAQAPGEVKPVAGEPVVAFTAERLGLDTSSTTDDW